MKKRLIQLAALTLTARLGVSQSVFYVTTDAPTGAGSLTAAITALNHGDTIAFNISGGGVHYIQTPPDGYPLITKNNITIDGYTQPGASPNTASIHSANNAVLKICLTSTNGNALSMETAINNSWGSPIPRIGYGDDEQAILGFFHATNATVKGLAILASHATSTSIQAGTCKAIAFAANSAENGGGQCQNWKVSGCWFGVEPTTRQLAHMPDGVAVATPRIAIASYRTRNAAAPDNPIYNYPGTIGVAAGFANPRADFNIIITGYGFDAEGREYRISGNFWNVLPDGMTHADMSTLNGGAQLGDGFVEIGRDSSSLTIGTDGDGVNDADEGNVFAGFGLGGAVILDIYSDPRTNIVVAGNYVGVAIDGVTTFSNVCTMFDTFGGQSSGRIGSDFDGVSDALECNVIYNNNPFALQYPTPIGTLEPQLLLLNAGARVSFRGNKTVNNDLLPFNYANDALTRLTPFTNYAAPFMDVASANGIIPALATTNIYPNLSGTFAPGIAPYTNISIDVYQLDPEGWNNGKLFLQQELTDMQTYTNGYPQGKKYLGTFPVPNTGSFSINVAGLDFDAGAATVTANYSADPVGTHNGRTHTSDFSMPANFIPGGAESVGLARIVPDTIVWFSSADNKPHVGNFVVGQDVANGGSVEASAGVLGDSTFLLAASMKADDGVSMRFTSIYQPAAGGAPKLGDLFYADDGTPYTSQINNSRQDGNPGRVTGDPRYGAINFMGAGEASLWAYPTAFNSDGRFTKVWYDWSGGIFREAFVQAYSLNPITLNQTMLFKAQDSAFGRLPAGTLQGAGADGSQLSRTGGTVVGLDNGNFVSVVEDRAHILNPSGNASTATIFAPNGSIVKDSFLVANGDQWANVGAFKGGFYVRPSGGVIYFFDNAGNLQGSLNHNTSSGLAYDTGRGDGTRTCSDIRSHYVFMAGRAPDNNPGPVFLSVFDANTRTFVTKAPVSDTDTALHALDRVNVACDALNRVCVTFRLRPIAFDFGSSQVAARVLNFDGTNLTYLTHSFFPFINHDSVGGVNNFITQESWPAMTTRQIFIYAEGTVNSTNNPAAPADTAAQTHVYTVLSHPAPVAAPQPGMSITRSGDNTVISWDADAGLFVLQSRADLVAGAWADVIPPGPTVKVGNQYQLTTPDTGPLKYYRLVRRW